VPLGIKKIKRGTGKKIYTFFSKAFKERNGRKSNKR
jgi:hypothetical protein